MRVDLHTHTDASDGCDTARSLLQAAQAAQIKILAVTDHDSIGNVAEAVQLAPAYGIKLVPGVEISCTAEGKDYHILGYNINWENKRLREVIAHNTAILERKDLDTINRLMDLGWPVSCEEYHQYRAPKGVGGWQALNYLKSKGLCLGVEDFFQRIFIKENGLGFPEFVPHTEVVQVIHQAGGVAVLAHSGSSFHGLSLKLPWEVFKNVPLDGYECYHPGHSPQTAAILREHCREYGLLATAGSDYHGAFAPGRRLGIPEVYSRDLNLTGLI